MMVSGSEITSRSLKIYKAKAQVSLWEIGLIKIGLVKWQSEVPAKYRTSGRDVIRKSGWLSIL